MKCFWYFKVISQLFFFFFFLFNLQICTDFMLPYIMVVKVWFFTCSYYGLSISLKEHLAIVGFLVCFT